MLGAVLLGFVTHILGDLMGIALVIAANTGMILRSLSSLAILGIYSSAAALTAMALHYLSDDPVDTVEAICLTVILLSPLCLALQKKLRA